MKTLNEQYQLIKEGKGHKGVFLTEAKRQFPNYIRNAATFEEAALILKQREIIHENVTDTSVSTTVGVQKESFELAFNKFLTEAKDPQVKAKEVKAKKVKSQEEPEKAEAKKTSKQVEEDLDHNYDNKNEKNPDNLIFDQIMMGYYAEMKDPKNSEKTMQELKDMVFKNLAKDSIYYTKNAQFGVKDLGYSVDHPGLGEPKEAKGKYKASGYGDLNEVFYGDSDGDRDADMESTVQANEYYDKGLEAYNEGDKLKAEKYYQAALKAGAWLGWTENDLPPYDRVVSESKLRKVISQIIREEMEEAYQMVNINPNKKGEGDIYIPQFYILPPEARKKLNLLNPGENAPTYKESFQIPHFKMLPGNNIGFSNWLVQAIENPKDVRNPLTGIINDLNRSNEDFRSFLTYTKKFISTNKIVIPTRGIDATYYELDFPEGFEVLPLKEWAQRELEKSYEKLARAESGEVRRGRPVNIPSLKKFIQRLEILSSSPEGGVVVVLPPFFTKSLMESVEKELAAINKEAEHEILQSKLDKINDLIEKKRSQLSKLDEDEDMKALTDKKKVKELEKDIKKLEVARKKIEKMLHKTKGKKKEVIDEMEGEEPSPELLKALSQADEMYEGGLDIDTILVKFNPRMRNDIERHLRMGHEGTDND
jgi:hypothetical protein